MLVSMALADGFPVRERLRRHKEKQPAKPMQAGATTFRPSFFDRN